MFLPHKNCMSEWHENQQEGKEYPLVSVGTND